MCFDINDTLQDFEGFKNLFGKFINSTGPSVNWDKIEKLPQESVSKIAIIRHLCHDLFTKTTIMHDNRFLYIIVICLIKTGFYV